MKINRHLGIILLAGLTIHSAFAQTVTTLNGTYSVTESWSATLQVGTGRSIATRTYHGSEKGTLTISNGVYTLINRTGAPTLPHAMRTITYDSYYSDYYIGGTLQGIGGGLGGFFVELPLTFFAVKIPLGSTGGFSGGDASGSSSFATSGSSLGDLSGEGSYLDGNAPDTTNGYLNQLDWSSTASLGSPGGTVKYTITVSASPPGSGKVTGGGTLKAGATAVVKATPASGATFSDWTDDFGDILSLEPSYSFVVDADTNLIANFVPNPFTAAAGVYNGLFSPVSDSTVQNSGYFSLTVTTKGKFSGYLETGSTRHPISGQFDDNGNFSGSINVAGQSWMVSISLDLSGGNDVGGTFSDGTWSANVSGNKSVFNARTQPASQVGRYTMTFAGTNDSTALPAGNGYATVSISKAGAVTLAGSMADGTKITQSTILSQTGEWPLYVALYRGEGCVAGWASLDGSGNISGNIVWIKPVSASGYYPGGFMFSTTVSGGPYVAADASGSFDFTQAVFTGGDLGAEITNQITIGSHYKVTNLSSNRLTMTFNSSTGVVQGSVVNPALPGSKGLPFSGIVLQTQNAAVGYFLDGSQSGTFTLGVP